MSKCDQNKYYRWLRLTKLGIVAKIVLFMSVMIVGGIIVFDTDAIANDNVVLAFFGILATFVVISNFSQVNSVREEAKDYLRELKEHEKEKITEWNTHNDTYKQELNDKVEDLKSLLYTENNEPILNGMKSKIGRLEKSQEDLLKRFVEEYDAIIEQNVEKYCNKTNKLISYLINGAHRELLIYILQYRIYPCNVTLGEEEYQAQAYREHDRILFRIPDITLTIDVDCVNHKAYNSEEMEQYIATFKSLTEKEERKS